MRTYFVYLFWKYQTITLSKESSLFVCSEKNMWPETWRIIFSALALRTASEKKNKLTE